MLSSVVASRSVSSDNANLFFAAETRCTGWIVMLYKKKKKKCFKVRNISRGSDSNSVGWQQPTQKRALISGLAQLTKTNLQLQHSTWQVEKKMEEDNDIFSHRGVLDCHSLRVLACITEKARETGVAGLGGGALCALCCVTEAEREDVREKGVALRMQLCVFAFVGVSHLAPPAAPPPSPPHPPARRLSVAGSAGDTHQTPDPLSAQSSWPETVRGGGVETPRRWCVCVCVLKF